MNITQATHIVALDFSKAYDTVWHAALIYKLFHFYHIRGRVLYWINSFLTTRKTRVSSEGKHSKWKVSKQGLPQGSGLSPILYILFTNDYQMKFPHVLSMGTFADDTVFWNKPHQFEHGLDVSKALQGGPDHTSPAGATDGN